MLIIIYTSTQIEHKRRDMVPYASLNDHRKYYYFELDNQLRILLISDPQSDKSALSLAVNAGHFNDPQDRQGMAHFLEHMLFLGTSRYPNPGEYQQFINRHGGNHNAWTGSEFTNYFFEIEHHFFEAALDRFSQFFISPLFDPTWVDKERHAIDAEYRLKLKDDVRRSYQVHKETVNPKHPFAKFSVGNLETLSNDPTEDLRAELIDFYNAHYSAERMGMVMLSPQTIETQIAWCQHYFTSIPNRQLAPQACLPLLYRPEDLGIYIHIQPLREQRMLSLTFPLANMDVFYDRKPLTFLSHLLGDEGAGSLLALLKKRGWANKLSAGGGVSGANFQDFVINISLTPLGLTVISDIVELVFGYLKMIEREGLEAWRYDEKKIILDQHFRFQERGRSVDIVSGLVLNIFYYQLPDLLRGDYLMKQYDDALMRQIVDKLTPDNLRITITSPEQITEHQARWYQTPYRVAIIPDEHKTRWRNSYPHEELTLPAANPFISYRIAPRKPETKQDIPYRIIEQSGFRLWHLHEYRFKVPKGNIYISFERDAAVNHPHYVAMTQLALELLADRLNALTYPAKRAGLGYQFHLHQRGFTLTIGGVVDKQLLLLDMLLNNEGGNSLEAPRFIQIKEQLIRSWENQGKARPISLLFNLLTNLLQPNNPSTALLLEHVRGVEFDDMLVFISQLMRSNHIECLLYGDWYQRDAMVLTSRLTQYVNVGVNPSAMTYPPLISIQHSGTLVYNSESKHHDSALLVYYQSPSTDADSIAHFALTNHIMSSSFFHELRTRQQLGYVVGSGNLTLNRHPGLIFYIQSSVAEPSTLLNSVEEFVDSFPLALLALTQEQWLEYKAGLQSQLKERDKTLHRRGQRLWNCIINDDLTFDLRQRIHDVVDTLERVDLIRFITKLCSRTSDRLILCSYGEGHETEEKIEGQIIVNIDEFQSTFARFNG